MGCVETQPTRDEEMEDIRRKFLSYLLPVLKKQNTMLTDLIITRISSYLTDTEKAEQVEQEEPSTSRKRRATSEPASINVAEKTEEQVIAPGRV